MNVNRISNQSYFENNKVAKAKEKSSGGAFYESLSENINEKVKAEQKNVAAAKNAAVNAAYPYHRAASAVGVYESESVGAAVVSECEARHIAYQESDYVKVFASEGFSFMAQVDVEARSIYIEKKVEDGTLKGYEVSIDKLDKETTDPVEQMALAAWEKKTAQTEDEQRALTAEEALSRFYEFIEDRIKNGPPKYMTGNSEFSIEEWDKLMESIDGQIDAAKEEAEERIEKMKEQQLHGDIEPLKADSKNASYEEIQALNASRVYAMETQLTSGIIGFGQLEDGTRFEAKYADSSTDDKPVVQVRMWAENGTEKVVNIDVNQVEVTAATQLEMLAWLSHMDAQGRSGYDELMGSYRDLLYRAENSSNGDVSAKNMQDFMHWRQNWHDMTLSTDSLSVSEMQIKALTSWNEEMEAGVPYGHLAKDGIIEYKGVVFVCDKKHKALHLGDTSDMNKCIRIPLSKGGCLIVNRDNLGDLATAIGMFSPEDVNLIMRAIAEDAKIQQMKKQIDDVTSGGELAESMEDEAEVDETNAEPAGKKEDE